MSLITGVITDKNGNLMEDVSVRLMNESFEDVISTTTNLNGEYCLETEDKHYPFMIAVKEYKEKYLEFWCQNINLTKDIIINGSIDKLEIYGLHCFRIHGAHPALTVYFRPMSLEKLIKGRTDISPNIIDNSINVSINNKSLNVLKVNRVEEYCGEICLNAYLIQISLPKKLLDTNENILDVKILDLDGHFGQASIFF